MWEYVCGGVGYVSVCGVCYVCMFMHDNSFFCHLQSIQKHDL